MKVASERPQTTYGLREVLQTLALWSLAVAQPLYDIFTANAEFFAVRGSKRLDVGLWMLIISLAAPMLLVAVVAATGKLNRRLQALLHFSVIALLAASLALVVLRRLDWPAPVLAALAVMLGLATAVALRRFQMLSQYLAVLAVGVLLFPAVFLVRSSVLRATSRQLDVDVEMPPIEVATPVVMVVFDELPTLSLLDEDRRIDPVRYPNLAALAERANWYRNAATVSEFTTTAVPALLTGVYPKLGLQPTATDHPLSLFTLLGPSYDLDVEESMGRLCPEEFCGEPAESLSQRLASLLSDSSIVYLHLLSPEAWRAFLPPVDQTWMDFGASERREVDETEVVIDDAYWQDVFRGRTNGDRAAHYLEFLSGIEPGNRRSLYFYHSLLPHIPLDYLPSGRLYTAERQAGQVVGEQWGGDDWSVTQVYQRHLLQVGFVDLQLGQLVRHLRKLGLFDSCLLIVTADHGVSHRPNDSRREMTSSNFADIAPVPLLIKLPDQQRGRIDDRMAELVDVMPTVAEVLEIDLPWEVDGVSLLGPEESTRSHYTVYLLDDPTPQVVKPDELRSAFDEALRTKLSLFGSGSDPEERFFQVGTYGEIVGRPIEEFSIRATGSVETEVFPASHSDSFDPDDGFVPSHIRGQARSPEVGRPVYLAVALNGIIRATTRTLTMSTRRGWNEWSAVVNENAFRRGKNEIEVFHIRPAKDGVELERTTSKVLSSGGGTAPLGVEPIHGVEESGFHQPQRFGDFRGRWTDGHATLSIPIDPANPPTSIRVDLVSTGPIGTRLEVLVNGEQRFVGDLPRSQWSSTFELDRARLADRIEVEIVSTTFVPRDTIPDGKDARTLGVGVGGVWLLSD